jgi:choline dehydrogenase-like flavoprotein
MSGPVIVGGGPAGAAAAISLARAGLRPRLLERDRVATEKVCGEFLAEDAARRLATLGVDLPRLGALPLRRALFGAGSAEATLRLPFAAWSLPRAVLDAALLRAAQDAGATVEMGVAVREATACSDGWSLRIAGEEPRFTPALILATGKHDMRGLQRAASGGAVGLKLVLAGEMPRDAVAVLACAGGYAGLQPRAGGGGNLCAALDPRAPGVAEAARSAAALIAHVASGSALAARLLAGLRAEAARPMAVARVPYGFLHRGAGPFRVGDQAAVIPSFCGDGVAMALLSGARAAEACRRGETATLHHAGFAASVTGGMRMARAVAALVRHAPRLMVGGVAWLPGLAGAVARRTRLG